MVDIKKLQNVQLEMLKEADRICKKHNIKYSLFAGTALGAVRHKGFIPWDDDLDIIMLREDYEKFLKVAKEELGEDYYMQEAFSAKWPMQFSKIRKNNTAFIERYKPKMEGIHMGVYVDVFPCDNLSNNNLVAKLQFLASKVVIAKALDRRGYLTDSKAKKIFMALCKMLPGKLIHKWSLLKGKKTDRVHCFYGAASKMSKSIFPREWITETTPMTFEDGEFPCPTHYDKMLTALYGDYMTPLPPDERGMKVHAEIVDLDNSYEQYLEVQKNMEFKEYTRSIR